MWSTISKYRVLAAAIPLLLFTSCKLGFLGVNSEVTSSQVGSASYIPGPATRLGFDGVASWVSGKCSPVFTVTGIDDNGAPSANFPQGTLVGLTGIEANTIYLDPACTIPEPSRLVPVVGNSNRAEFYLKPTINGPKMLTASIDGMPSTSSMVMIQSGAPSKITLTFPASINANQCVAGSLGLFDEAGNAAKAAYDISSNLSLSVNNGTAIYSDASCDNVINSTTIPANVEQKLIYTFAPVAAPFTVTNSGGTGLTGSQKTITVLAANMPKLFVRGPANLIAGVCTPYQIETYTPTNSVYKVRVNTPINLTGSLSTTKFFSDAQCTGTLAGNTTTIATFASAQTIYVTVTQADQNLIVEASSAGYTTSNVTNPVMANVPKQIVFSGVPDSIPAGRCSNAIQASLKDQYGNTAKAAAALPLALAYTGEMLSFHTTADCGGAGVSAITVNNNESSTTFYFKARNPGASTFSASANGLNPANSGTITIKNALDVPNVVKLSALANNPVAVAGECLELRLKSFDANNYPLDVYPNDISFALSSNSTQATGFFSDSSCTNNIANVALVKETNQSVLYYKITKTEAQPILVTAESTTPALMATIAIGTAAAPPAQLEIASNITAVPAATCGSVVLSSKDRFGNRSIPTNDMRITLEGGEFVHFYKDANCTDEGREVTLSGANSIPIYFKVDSQGNNASTNLITLVGIGPVGVAAGSKTIAVMPPPPIHVALRGDSAFEAGVCSEFSATALDANNSPLVREPIIVQLSAQGATGNIFFNSSNCGTGLANNSLTISQGQNPAKFWVKTTVAGDISISTDTGSTGASTISVTIQPKTPSALNFVAGSGSSTFMMGTCSGPYVVESRDQFGNLSPVSNELPLSVTFDPNVTGHIFQDDACTTGGAKIAKDSSSTQFYLKAGGFGDIRITLGGAPLSGSSRSFTIQNPATVTFTVGGIPLTSHSFGDVEMGTVSTALEVTITNSSPSQVLEIASLSLATPFQRMGGNCPSGAFSLPVQGSCTQNIAFVPTALGSFGTNFTVAFTSGAPEKKLLLSGTGITPNAASLVFNPASLDFGTVLTGGKYLRNVILKNVGTRPASSLNFADASELKWEDVTNCPDPVAPNEECTVKVSFAPGAEGPFTQSLSVNFQDGANAKTATLRTLAEVKRPAELFFTVNSLAFGSVLAGNSKSLVVTIENRGLLGASAISMSTGGVFAVTSTTCGSTLPAGGSCAASVRFMPTGSADYAGELSLTYSSEGIVSDPITKVLPLNGTGFRAAELTFSPLAMTFPNTLLGTFRTLPVQIKNIGDVAASSIQFIHAASDFFSIDSSNCPSSLTQGASCNVNLRFAPVSAIDYRDTFQVSYFSGATPIASSDFLITGKGVTPASLTLSPNPLDFGGVVVGDLIKKSFVVKNMGLDSAVNFGIGVPASTSPLQLDSHDCTTRILPGAECNVVISFSPTTQTASTQNFNFSFRSELASPNSTPAVVTASAVGNGVAGSNLTLSVSAIDFGTVLKGSSATRQFTVGNDSGNPIQSILIGSPASPFSRSGGTCPSTTFTLNASESCTVIVQVATTTVGSSNSQLKVSYSNGARIIDKLIPLTALVGVEGMLTFPSLTYSMGQVAVGGQKSLDVLIVNEGDFEAQVTNYAVPGAPFSVALQGCATVPAKGNCVATFTFKPTASGTYQLPFTFDYRDLATGNSGNASTTINAEAFVAGTLVGNLSVIPLSSTIVGGKSVASLTISHRGDGTTSGITNTLQPFGSEFVILRSSCAGQSLNAGDSCYVDLSFEPKSAGPKTAKLIIGYQNSLGAQTLEVSLSATALTPAKLVLSEEIVDLGTVAVGASFKKQFTITNNGQDGAKSISLSRTTNAAFSFASSCGTEPFTLASGASCAYEVKFTPTAAAFSSLPFQMNYLSNESAVGSAPLTTPGEVRGVGVLASSLKISQTIVDFGDPVLNSPYPTRRVTLKNDGLIGFSGINVRGMASPFSIRPVSCPVFPATLDAGAACDFDIVMDTRTAGRYSSNFYIDYHNTVAPQTIGPVPVTGFVGVIGSLTLAQSSLYFTKAYLGGTSETKVNVTNTGDYDIQISGVESLVAPYGFNLSECSPTIKPHATCAVIFNITPTTLGVQPVSVVNIVYRSLASTASGRIPFTLSGNAINPSGLVVSPTSFDFGNTLINGTPKGLALTFKPTGPNAVKNIKVTLQSASTEIAINANVCSTLAQLPVGSSCEVNVGFLPTAPGLKSAVLTYSYTNEVSAETTPKTVNITGFAIAPAKIVLTPTLVDVGYAAVGGNSGPQRFTLANQGGDTAKVSTVVVTDGAFKVKAISCPVLPFTLSAGQSCDYELTLSPTLIKQYDAKLAVGFSSLLGSSALSTDTALRGIGVAPGSLMLPESIVDFGMPSQNTTATKSFVLVNNNNIDLTNVSIGPIAAPFSFTLGSCGSAMPFILKANSQCAIQINLSTVNAGTFSSTFVIKYVNGAVATQTGEVSVKAIVGKPGKLVVLPASYIFASTALGTAQATSLELQNTGDYPLSILSVPTVLGSFSLSVSSCTTIAPGAKCAFKVGFAPSAIGTTTATFPFVTRDTMWNSGSATLQLSGSGLPPGTLVPALTASNFGSLPQNYPATNYVIYFSNNGGGNAYVTAINFAPNSSEISYRLDYPANACKVGLVVAPGASCGINVVYTPRVVGPHSANLSLTYSNSQSTPTTANVTISGTTTFAGKWYQVSGASCSTYCSGIRKTSTLSPEGSNCASGENVPASAAPIIQFGNCWPGIYNLANGYCSAHGGIGSVSSGAYCYVPGQKMDNDSTDVTKGCYCR